LDKENLNEAANHKSTIQKRRFDMFRGILPLTLSLCLGAAAAPTALAQSAAPISEQEAHAIAVDAYVYFYPLLSMDISRKQFTNVEPGKEFGKGPMNMFVNGLNIHQPISKVWCAPISTRCIPSYGST